MTNTIKSLRPGLTAIAAVLALSSTPLLAQSSDGAAALAPAPVLVTPPPAIAVPVSAPEAPVVGVTVPQTAAASTADPVSSTATVANSSAAVTEPAPKPVLRTAPAGKPVVKTPAPVKATQTTAQVKPSPPPVAAALPTKAEAAPVVETPAAIPAQTSVARTETDDEVLPIAGAAGLALLAMGGGIAALARRRRRGDDLNVLTDATVPDAEPVRATRIAPPPTGPTFAERDPSATADLPADFDLSRFGFHTQAAYRGPTANNPSLSLKRRLKRASFFDQRERIATHQSNQGANGGHAMPVATNPVPAQQSGEYVTTRIKRPARPAFRPAYSS